MLRFLTSKLFSGKPFPDDWIADYEKFAGSRAQNDQFLSAKHKKEGHTKKLAPIVRGPTALSFSPIPKIIWIFWAQGWNDAPPIVRLCHEQWQKMNPDWEVRFLDKKTAQEASGLDLDFYQEKFMRIAVGEAFFKKKFLAATSDVLRIALLNRHGGVWTDAATWCTRPLNDWINLAAMSGFFAFYLGPPRTIASWFLAAARHNPLIHQWHKAVQTWTDQTNKLEHYFWFHYMMGFICQHNEAARKVWNETPKIQLRRMYVTKYMYETNFPELVRYIIEQRTQPIVKFNIREKFPENFANTPLALLLGRDSLI